MPVKVIVGAQLGDEGKGKITDRLAADAAAIVRFQGGNNAGHTIVTGGVTHKFHLLPSGVLHEGALSVLGNGVVIDPMVLGQELDSLEAGGISDEGIRISPAAHLIMPYHVAIDHAEEEARAAKDSIGTTRRGIGPCYADKAARLGIRFADALDKDRLRERVGKALAAKAAQLEGVKPAREGDPDPADCAGVSDWVFEKVARFSHFAADVSPLLWQLLERDELVICEGAQGALLDIDHGTYPFVTSSNTIAAAACVGAGIPPQAITEIWGVAKAYPTRIDTVGPFPTKMSSSDPEIDELLIDRGHEYGTTTGRRRRCGWLDLISLRHAVRLNGITNIALTKLDVMHGIDPLKLCTEYRVGGLRTEDYPTELGSLADAKPVYEELPGFSDQISEARRADELPREVIDLAERVGGFSGAPVSLIGVGQDREAVVEL